MEISVDKSAKGWVATGKQGDVVAYASNPHPRPGCAVRELLNYFHFHWGEPKVLTLEIKDWR